MKDLAEEQENWKRVRSVIEHENTLINHRVTWLLASQGFLLAGYSALITSWAKGELHIGAVILVTLLAALFVISAYICISMGIMLFAAIKHIKLIQCWWYRIPIGTGPESIEEESRSSELNVRHPYLQGWKARRRTRLFGTEFMPYFFLGAWIILLLIGVIAAYPKVWTDFLELNKLTRILAVVVVFGAAVALAAIGYFYGKRSAEEPPTTSNAEAREDQPF